MEINEIRREIKKYIAVEQKDMYKYEHMSDKERIETEAIIKALTDEKLNKIIKKTKFGEVALCYDICDIFENMLYRISNKEYDFLFKNKEYISE